MAPVGLLPPHSAAEARVDDGRCQASPPLFEVRSTRQRRPLSPKRSLQPSHTHRTRWTRQRTPASASALMASAAVEGRQPAASALSSLWKPRGARRAPPALSLCSTPYALPFSILRLRQRAQCMIL